MARHLFAINLVWMIVNLAAAQAYAAHGRWWPAAAHGLTAAVCAFTLSYQMAVRRRDQER
jgi:hypothetical protein